jgi:hypothetical protein
MGLDRFKKTPCGFCFVEYYSHEDALDCMKYIGGTKLDERIIRTDLDEGFSEGRQYGYAGVGEDPGKGIIADTVTGVVNLVARFVTSIAMSMIRDEAGMVGRWLRIWTMVDGDCDMVRILRSASKHHIYLPIYV